MKETNAQTARGWLDSTIRIRPGKAHTREQAALTAIGYAILALTDNPPNELRKATDAAIGQAFDDGWRARNGRARPPAVLDESWLDVDRGEWLRSADATDPAPTPPASSSDQPPMDDRGDAGSHQRQPVSPERVRELAAAELLDRLTQTRAEVERLTADRDSWRKVADVHAARVQQLDRDHRVATAERDEARRDTAAQRQARESLLRDLAKHRDEITRARDSLAAMTAARDILATELDETLADWTLRGKRVEYLEGEYEHLTRKLASSDQSRDQQAQTIRTMRKNLDDVIKTHDDLLRVIAQHQTGGPQQAQDRPAGATPIFRPGDQVWLDQGTPGALEATVIAAGQAGHVYNLDIYRGGPLRLISTMRNVSVHRLTPRTRVTPPRQSMVDQVAAFPTAGQAMAGLLAGGDTAVINGERVTRPRALFEVGDRVKLIRKNSHSTRLTAVVFRREFVVNGKAVAGWHYDLNMRRAGDGAIDDGLDSVVVWLAVPEAMVEAAP